MMVYLWLISLFQDQWKNECNDMIWDDISKSLVMHGPSTYASQKLSASQMSLQVYWW